MTCTQYCDAALKDCTGTLAVYPDQATCLATCALFPVGMKGATTGDTIECRITTLANMAIAPAKRCARGGPGGFNSCGPACTSYCTIMAAACPMAYATPAACEAACMGFVSNGVEYSIHDVNQNTLQCRLYYATIALVDGMQCQNALPMAPGCP